MKYRYSLNLLLVASFVVAPGARAFTSIDYGPDWTDDKVLIAESTNVFVGKVIAEVGTNKFPWAMNPNVNFSVHPILNIKGKLASDIVIGQFTSATYPLLQSGSTYVFAANHSSDNLYLIGVYPYDDRLLTTDSGLSDAQIKNLAENADLVIQYQESCPNQIGYANKIIENKDCQPLPAMSRLILLKQSLLTKAGIESLVVAAAVGLLIVSFVWWRRQKRTVGQPSQS